MSGKITLNVRPHQANYLTSFSGEQNISLLKTHQKPVLTGENNNGLEFGCTSRSRYVSGSNCVGLMCVLEVGDADAQRCRKELYTH